jgi:hypothetical protein
MTELTGLFKARYSLRGRDWIRRIDPDDQRVLIEIGLRHADFGRMGGQARARSGKRGSNGRFIKDDGGKK